MKPLTYKIFLFILLVSIAVIARDIEEFRAVKLTNVDSNVLFSDESIAEAMDYLASININTVLVVVWNSNSYDGNYTLYPSVVMDSLFGLEIGPIGNLVSDPLQRVIIEAHRVSIEVLPWFEMGFATSWGDLYSDEPDHILRKFPEWALRESDDSIVWKNGFFWMSAINPDVQKLIMDLTLEVCYNYDIDGIEYSDRIPALPVEGGYDSVTVAIYKLEHDGAEPPGNYHDSDWMRWRADKLSDWYRSVRDSIKAYDPNIHVSSSPSVYPWSYNEYLQDSYTWMNTGICDDIIPQLYRYNYTDYLYTLNSSIGNFSNNRHTYFAGILMNINSGPGGQPYILTPETLNQMIAANRERNIMGEAFFFYEGLRKNDSQLGTTLLNGYYSERALLPHRSGQVWRPKATIVNEDGAGISTFGNWELYETSSYGFQPNILINKDTLAANIEYTFNVPHSAWYDVFAYNVRSVKATKNAHYVVFGSGDSSDCFLDQTDYTTKGWQLLKTVYLETGNQKVVSLNNDYMVNDEWLIADAVMIMINRKKSPDLVILSNDDKTETSTNIPKEFILRPNYPNPFNANTNISYSLQQKSHIRLQILDLHGREVTILENNLKSAGNYAINFNASGLASGVYFSRIEVKTGTDTKSDTRKMLLLK